MKPWFLQISNEDAKNGLDYHLTDYGDAMFGLLKTCIFCFTIFLCVLVAS